MKALLIALNMVFALNAHAQAKNVLELHQENTVVLRGVVDSSSVAMLEVKLLAMSATLPDNEVIYLILDTPGGSVSDGTQLIDFINGLPQTVKTVSLFAASMGFQIAQNLGERLVLPSSTLMSHRASMGGLEGQVPGELLTRLNYYLRDLRSLDQRAANRMRMSLKSYQRLIDHELWLKGSEAVRMRAADRVIYAKCDKSYEGTEELELGQFMGIPIMASMSKCPLITGFLAVYAKMPAEGQTKEYLEAKKMSQVYKSDKIQFVKDYIVSGKLTFDLKY